MDNHINQNKNDILILHKIKIISVNVNSIIKNQRRASLFGFINKHKPDIVLINETKLSKNHVLRFEKYNVLRNDRNDKHPGGGTAIIIRKDIKYNTIEVSVNKNEKEKVLEYTITHLALKENKNLYIISAYARCGYHKEFIPELNKLFTKLKLENPDNYYLLAGDLNSKHSDWKNPNCNSRGLTLKHWIDNNNIMYRLRLLSTKYPSYPNGNSYLDIVLADQRITFQIGRAHV